MNAVIIWAILSSIALFSPAIKCSVTCPNHKQKCPSMTTCCLMRNLKYGCCPLPKAVCCSDSVHCCPHGTTCDVLHFKCNKSDGNSVEMLLNSRTELVSVEKIDEVMCADNKTECPKGSTCCPLVTGKWGCCPAPNAVCCADRLHCCPHGTICDDEHGRCKYAKENGQLKFENLLDIVVKQN